MTIKQTAGRDRLGNFAPDFAHFNDDILFGENWNIEAIDLKTRCLLTVTTLIASGITDSSLSFHLQNAKNNGVTKDEIAATITHIAFYAGWPKAWAAFNLAKDVWTDQPNKFDQKFSKKFPQESSNSDVIGFYKHKPKGPRWKSSARPFYLCPFAQS